MSGGAVKSYHEIVALVWMPLYFKEWPRLRVIRKETKAPLKILLVTYSAYPRIGGRSTYMSLLMEKLNEMGHEVDLLAHKPGLNEIYIVGKKEVNKLKIRQRVEAHMDGALRKKYPHLTPWIRWRELERYVFEAGISSFDLSSYDLIHAQDIFSSMACTRLSLSQPVIASFHNCKAEEWKVNQVEQYKAPLERAYISREEYLSILRPKKVIVPSRWLKVSFEKLGVPLSRCTVIPYGIDLAQFERNRDHPLQGEKQGDKFILLVPARLVPIKGHTFLFQALERLKRDEVKFECWLAGNGVLEAQLRTEVRQRRLADVVRFLGGREDVPSLMMKADLMVLPTLHDTFPFAILEAQGAGLPVIATAVGGVPEMIEHGKTGYLVPPKDVEALYAAISRLIKNDPLRQKISEASRLFAARSWNASLMAKRTLAVYEEVLRDGASKKEAASPLSGGRGELDHALLDGLTSHDAPWLSTGTIVGQIEGQSPLAPDSIQVHLLDISWITLKSTSPDRWGCFRFEDVPVGRYGLMVSDGKRMKSGHVVVEAGKVSDWNVSLD